ncbi:hypothetical protein [Aquibacillus saliphilus]|uniref:hypothetical protein n=1 Tax=Aquibacillus saliphilus TaxID=1909422 RepID=UPI001CEFE81F|nr:hypothetical protein [Aquibacillus saliphilus]
MGKDVDKFIPVLFQKLKTFEDETEDTRFLKVKIWLCHTGENLNGSYFDKSIIEDAIPSLANTPILAFVEENSDGDEDFSDHRMILVKEDDEFKIKYIGQAIGTIPSDNNAQFEMRLGDDGVEREYLTVEGLIWTKWDDPIDIFNRNQFKSQSMELHDNYSGEWGDDNLFHFTSFQFFGACALGDDVLPAMHSSTIEAQFSENKIFEGIQKRMNQFKDILSETEKGGKKQVDEKLELLKEYSLTEEDLTSKEIKLEDYSVEQLDEKLKEITSSDNKDFTLVASQLRDEIRAELYKDLSEDEWGYHYHNYWYVDHTDNMVIAEDNNNHYRLVGLTYTNSNDVISIDFESKKRIKLAYETVEGDTDFAFDLASKDRAEYDVNVKEKQVESEFKTKVDESKTELDKMTKDFSNLEEEVKDLRQFKSTRLSEERAEQEKELFESFSSELTEDEIKDVKDAAPDYSLEEIEEKLFTLVGKKKSNFSKQTKKDKQSTIKIGVSRDNHNDKPIAYGGIFEKYNN